MAKGLRVLLHIFQVLFLLGSLMFLTFTFLEAYMDLGMSEGEAAFAETWVIGLGVLAIACSPSLWSLKRAGAPAPAASVGAFDRVAPAAPSQPAAPGGLFEPVNSANAPAPPASSYGQPTAGSSSSPQSESPWGSGR